ncbi:ATP-grasp domain-containing protein [Methanocaldococcus indicus]|uniref:ATP-grasp domain-containing protein n=1 Tax=Methanocaldococcus indicus TaxID=213231 RepID=UPI003C6D9365
MKALVLGVNTRAVVNSLKTLGFYVISVSYYSPEDLNADENYYFINKEKHGNFWENYNERLIIEKANELVDDVDYIFICSGVFEHYYKKVDWNNIVGNSPKVIYKLSNKYYIYKKLKNLGYSIPEFKKINNIHQLEKFLDEYKKIVIKPFNCKGVIKLSSYKDIGKYNLSFPVLAQEYISSPSYSINFINNNFITFNKQIIFNGIYAGNIVPYSLPKKLIGIFEDIIEIFELKGMNGFDFLIDDDVKIIDVNPRILGTYDSIEISSNNNLAKSLLFNKKITPKNRVIKRIIFAKKRGRYFVPNIEGFYDIPKNGAIIEKNNPITTIIKEKNIKEEIKRIKCDEYEIR